MTVLIVEQGPDIGRQFPLKNESILGRQADAAVCLTAKAVSRQHAQINEENGAYFVRDLGSSNGTFLNGERLPPHAPESLTEHDRLQIGPYVLALCPEPTVTPSEESLVIREQISVVGLDQSLYGHAAAQKLQVVLEIAQHVARTLELEPLLEKLLDQLMRLFPHADRTMILLLESDNLVVRGQRARHAQEPSIYPYSRTVVKRALDDGVGLLSEDVQDDRRFDSSATLMHLNLHSLLCVPLITNDGRRLGVIQVDRFRQGAPFSSDDLQMLTAIGLQMAIVLDNADLHAQLLQEQRLRQELELAREIQQGYLPDDFQTTSKDGFELFAVVNSAREVSGDLYNFSRLPDGRLSFLIGDVAGKGMPAALLTVAVHTLTRHLTAGGNSPAKTLARLSDSLAKDNLSGRFVTVAHGLFDPKTGEVVVASGGHPMPMLRRANGKVEEIPHKAGRPLGYEGLPLKITDYQFKLERDETLVFFTDGLIEARHPESKELFGFDRLKELVHQFENRRTLEKCAELTRASVQEFTGLTELQDDLTLLLLRRSAKTSDTEEFHAPAKVK